MDTLNSIFQDNLYNKQLEAISRKAWALRFYYLDEKLRTTHQIMSIYYSMDTPQRQIDFETEMFQKALEVGDRSKCKTK